MIKVNSSQFNYTYNDETRFPYSIGTLVAYVKTKKNLEENFQFDLQGFLVVKNVS